MAFPLAAVAVGGLLGALTSGKKPKVPPFQKVSAEGEQANAIAGNVNNFSSAAELAGKTNDFSQEQLLKSLRQAIPGYDDLIAKQSSIIDQQMAGKLDQGVQDQISRTAAARSLSGGFKGSGMSRNLELRDIGMTSYQATQKGLDNSLNFLRAQAGIAVAPKMDITSMFFTPQQRLAHAVNERNLEFSRDMSHNQIAAMPNPMMSGILNGMAGAYGMAGGAGGLAGGIASGLGSLFGGGGGGGGGGGVSYGGGGGSYGGLDLKGGDMKPLAMTPYNP